MDFETLIFKKEDGIITITLNRPEKLNAINHQVEEDLGVAFEEVARDPEARVMVLTGAGRAFSAGGDISGASPGYGTTAAEISQNLRRIYHITTLRLKNLAIPTIAMVNGVASGWGFDLVLACDLRIGSEGARFNSAFVRVGLTPATGGVWLMPRAMGVAKAAELIFTGDFVEAEEAERLGILNKVVPAGELERETMSLARKIAQAPPLAIRLAKLQLYKGLQTNLEDAFEMAATCQAICIASEDFKEGAAAFREKRPAKFKGR
jgi:2-(1,2-epoxy-1,2-dihydrophenyl)acetyl-CoA isomerase